MLALSSDSPRCRIPERFMRPGLGNRSESLGNLGVVGVHGAPLLPRTLLTVPSATLFLGVRRWEGTTARQGREGRRLVVREFGGELRPGVGN